MAAVDVNGVTIEYEVRGSGEPILFVMGLGAQLVAWPDDFLDLFVDAGYQPIRFDNRDIGLSTQTDWEPPSQAKMLRSMITRRPVKDVGYTVPDMARDAAELLKALDIEAAHVVGVSMGGMIAQELAIAHPDKVRSLCSIMSNTGDRKNGGIELGLARKILKLDPPTKETAAEASVEMFRLFAGTHFDETEHLAMAREAVERSFTPYGVARQTAAIAGSRDRTPLLAGVTVPALVIHGLMDPLVKPSGGIATARAIPGSRLLMYPDMGHDLPRPRWREMQNAMVANFEREPQRSSLVS